MKTVEIYTTVNCKYCGMAKDFFKANNVQYSEHNIGENAEKRAEMVDISGQLGVPVIRIDDNVVIGYDERALKHLLEIA